MPYYLLFASCFQLEKEATKEPEEVEGEGSDEISALRRQRAALENQLSETKRLEAWRAQAVRQAAAGGPRGVEVEVRPIYILPDTNCYIDWLEGIARLAQPSSNYTVLVPIVGMLSVLAISVAVRFLFPNRLMCFSSQRVGLPGLTGSQHGAQQHRERICPIPHKSLTG